MMTVKELLKAIGGKSLSLVEGSFSGVGIDTRKDLQGKLFLALRGENFDGHDFLEEAVTQKASVLLVEEERDFQKLFPLVTVVKVEDSFEALQDLARHHRKGLAAKVAAITGSNGKTSIREFTYALLKDHQKTVRSEKSFNNHLGVPLTLLSASSDTEALLVEMGTNHAGELKPLCELTQPDVVLVSNIASAHLGFFKTLEEIAREKEEIYRSSRKNALCVFNLDDPWTFKMYQKYKQENSICFSTQNPKADVHFEILPEAGGLFLKGHIRGSGRRGQNLCCGSPQWT